VSKRSIEISVHPYQPTTASRRITRFWGLSPRIARYLRGGIAAAVCLAVHGLLLTQIIWSAGTPAAPHDELPAQGSVSNESAQEDMQWVALDPQALSDRSRPKPELPTNHLKKVGARKALAQAALLIPDVDLPPTPDATVADAGRLSKMYGRYVEQISARVDRVWLRPRTPIGSDSFSCRVRVTQDLKGNVVEVMLEQCNGDSRWQISLVQAIQSASPLPAPPDPDVFSRTVRLAFVGEAYTPQQRADDYETEADARKVIEAQETHAANIALSHIGDPRFSQNITISITGDHSSVNIDLPHTSVDESNKTARE